ENGGFYNEATPEGRDPKKEKIWWVEAEGLNALLLMHEHFGRETPRYGEAFVRQWDFIRRVQIDSIHGGWFATIAADGKPLANRQKSDRWTEGYHQGRALMNVIARLQKLAM
ncbi:MAG TPA: AGE family epimerase/isomerase, partial [Pirellulales bacterium]|nr:AGE family epimerase/isomerase [Pirellulales bacterium]